MYAVGIHKSHVENHVEKDGKWAIRDTDFTDIVCGGLKSSPTN